MILKAIKEEMLLYNDFYGGDLSDREAIKNAKSKKDLAVIIENHRDFLNDMLSDANSNLDHFKKRIGLTLL